MLHIHHAGKKKKKIMAGAAEYKEANHFSYQPHSFLQETPLAQHRIVAFAHTKGAFDQADSLWNGRYRRL